MDGAEMHARGAVRRPPGAGVRRCGGFAEDIISWRGLHAGGGVCDRAGPATSPWHEGAGENGDASHSFALFPWWLVRV
jgi:hypothetical protein